MYFTLYWRAAQVTFPYITLSTLTLLLYIYFKKLKIKNTVRILQSSALALIFSYVTSTYLQQQFPQPDR